MDEHNLSDKMICYSTYDFLYSVLARTDPKDVARVEKCTYMSTPEKRQTCPETAEGVKGHLANWISLDDLKKAIDERFPGCMAGEWISTFA